MEFVCNGGSWIPLTTEKKKNALCGQSNHVVSGKIFRYYGQNTRVENQAGERVGVVNVARLGSQRLAMPTAQRVLAFSPFQFIGVVKHVFCLLSGL